MDGIGEGMQEDMGTMMQEQLVGLGDSSNVILAAQARHALAISRLISDDGSWIEAHELEGLVLKGSDAISHCMLVGNVSMTKISFQYHISSRMLTSAL